MYFVLYTFRNNDSKIFVLESESISIPQQSYRNSEIVILFKIIDWYHKIKGFFIVLVFSRIKAENQFSTVAQKAQYKRKYQSAFSLTLNVGWNARVVWQLNEMQYVLV